MAQNRNIITQGLSGHVGDLIFYERNGKKFCRKMPEYGPDSMSVASKQSSREFAKASKAAKSIRAALNGIWQPAKDETTVYRLNKAVYAALREDTLHTRGKRVFSPAALHQHLKDFRYNKKAVMTIGGIDTIRQEDGSIKVQLPVNWQHWLKPPKDARYIQLQAVSLDMDLEQNSCLGTTTAASCVRLGEREHSLMLPVVPVRATATIVLLQIRFLHTDTGIQSTGTASSEQAFVTAVLEPVLPLIEKAKDPQQPAKTPRIAKKSRSAADMLYAVNQEGRSTTHFSGEAISERSIPKKSILIADVPEKSPPLTVFHQYDCDQFLV
ncbi:hypothetical protein [Chitinophaga ginsengisoli]|uniref:Uncharacterized protein n=1 Tax=Chitinophaga ginsengisoli TaxID=363837 RepID=A0A2P8FVW5_9BACT|nr:hypothetical protein [Chitinophaga ginsengisoli]PSL25859.1 hypothetical protein CLV42_11264 [Chitinophaga ginsengisoli]